MCISHYTLIFYYGNEYVFFTFWRNMLPTLNTYNGQLSNKKQKIKKYNSYSWVTHHPCQTVILIVSFFASFFSTFWMKLEKWCLFVSFTVFMFEVAVYVDYWHLSLRKANSLIILKQNFQFLDWHNIWSLHVYAILQVAVIM